MTQKIQQYLSDLLINHPKLFGAGTCITSLRSISGGDISTAYLVNTSAHRFFLKYNPSTEAYAMFKTEKKGLEAIAESQTIATPKVYICERFEKGAILLMEYIETKSPTTKEFARLGSQLAQLHLTDAHNLVGQGPRQENERVEEKKFGWVVDNYIGRLPQSNHPHNDWTSFYLEERIWPQLMLAESLNLLSKTDLPDKDKTYSICQELFGELQPALLHGDLWSGNYLVSTEGKPYLIDPAFYIGHHEVDIAMTKLFGGFDASFYNAYWECFPRTNYESERNDLYQLYYLIVHLNMFGKSYYASVKQTLMRLQNV